MRDQGGGTRSSGRATGSEYSPWSWTSNRPVTPTWWWPSPVGTTRRSPRRTAATAVPSTGSPAGSSAVTLPPRRSPRGLPRSVEPPGEVRCPTRHPPVVPPGPYPRQVGGLRPVGGGPQVARGTHLARDGHRRLRHRPRGVGHGGGRAGARGAGRAARRVAPAHRVGLF